MTDTTTTQQHSIPQTEHSVIKHWPNADEIETSLNCLRGTQTINWLGGLPKQRDFDGWVGGDGQVHVVYPPDDMSGSISQDDYLTFELTNAGPRGLVVDKLDGHDLRRGVCNLGGFENGQFYFDEARHYAESYKITHTESYDVWPAIKRHGGETPRGTKPSYIGGKKKTKQQRAVTKARRKQR